MCCCENPGLASPKRRVAACLGATGARQTRTADTVNTPAIASETVQRGGAAAPARRVFRAILRPVEKQRLPLSRSPIDGLNASTELAALRSMTPVPAAGSGPDEREHPCCAWAHQGDTDGSWFHAATSHPSIVLTERGDIPGGAWRKRPQPLPPLKVIQMLRSRDMT